MEGERSTCNPTVACGAIFIGKQLIEKSWFSFMKWTLVIWSQVKADHILEISWATQTGLNGGKKNHLKIRWGRMGWWRGWLGNILSVYAQNSIELLIPEATLVFEGQVATGTMHTRVLYTAIRGHGVIWIITVAEGHIGVHRPTAARLGIDSYGICYHWRLSGCLRSGLTQTLMLSLEGNIADLGDVPCQLASEWNLVTDSTQELCMGLWSNLAWISVDICGLCCHQRPHRIPESGLPPVAMLVFNKYVAAISHTDLSDMGCHLGPWCHMGPSCNMALLQPGSLVLVITKSSEDRSTQSWSHSSLFVLVERWVLQIHCIPE